MRLSTIIGGMAREIAEHCAVGPLSGPGSVLLPGIAVQTFGCLAAPMTCIVQFSIGYALAEICTTSKRVASYSCAHTSFLLVWHASCYARDCCTSLYTPYLTLCITSLSIFCAPAGITGVFDVGIPCEGDKARQEEFNVAYMATGTAQEDKGHGLLLSQRAIAPGQTIWPGIPTRIYLLYHHVNFFI